MHSGRSPGLPGTVAFPFLRTVAWYDSPLHHHISMGVTLSLSKSSVIGDSGIGLTVAGPLRILTGIPLLLSARWLKNKYMSVPGEGQTDTILLLLTITRGIG